MNAGYGSSGGTSYYGEDYTQYLDDGRATDQPTWVDEVGLVHQNDKETVTKHYTVDYLSTANRDIMVTADGQYTQRYVYDEKGTRISAEFGYADNTHPGEGGENPATDTAVNKVGKVWYRTSLLGSTLFAVDKNGDVISHTIYDPWGNSLTETATDMNQSGLENRNNYTGYTWDETLDLYYAQNRFYDATTHRFTQEDSVKDGTNWYVYCGNNPMVYVDSDGQVFFLVTAAIGAAIGAVVGGVTAAVKSYKETGKVDWGKTAKSAAVGALAGGLIGLGVGAVAAAVGSTAAVTTLAAAKISTTVAAAAIGGTAYGSYTAAKTYAQTGKIDAKKTILNTAVGMATGGVVGKVATSAATIVGNAVKYGAKEVAKALVKDVSISPLKYAGAAINSIATAVGLKNASAAANAGDAAGTALNLTFAGVSYGALSQCLTDITKTNSEVVASSAANAATTTATASAKTYQTYTKTNSQTGEVYSGRTSGTGNSLENVAKRDASHHMSDKGFGPAQLDVSTNSYNAARGREQMLIDYFGGAKSTGGTSGNAINGIGANNPNMDLYINSAKGEFGEIG